MFRFLSFLVCCLGLLVSVDVSAATVRCWGVATYRHGQTPVVFRSDRTGKTEKELWAKILFEDFLNWESQWAKEHPGQKLVRVQNFVMAGQKSYASIVCGRPTIEVVKWPIATYPKPKGLSPSTAWAVPGGQARAWQWDRDSGGWVTTGKNAATFTCKYAASYRVRDGEDLSEPRVLVHEKAQILGPVSYADSAIRASVLHGVMRLTRGAYLLVGEAGACWEDGHTKPAAPSGWPASETW